MRFPTILLAATLLTGLAPVGSASGAVSLKVDGATKTDAERAVQGYFALWSSKGDISAASVARFYAPRVTYYGKSFTRAQLLADKQAYARSWPVRAYQEVPGSFEAHCNADLTFCKVKADMTWRRVSRTGAVSVGRAHLTFDFVALEGGHKITREGAHIL